MPCTVSPAVATLYALAGCVPIAASGINVGVILHELTDDPAGSLPALTDDRFERDTVDILKRLSRKPVQPTPDSELLADLGFDSLLVLELVGELEDHFNIAVPLNALTHIRTVGQIVSEVRRLVAERERPA